MKQADVLKEIDKHLKKIEMENRANTLFDEFWAEHGEYFIYLKGRWDDEKEYEDWREYVKVIMERMEGYEIKMVLKVGIVIRKEGIEMTVRVNKRDVSYTWRELP